MNFRQIVRTAGEKANKNSPTILTGVGVAGLISTVVLSIRGTILAVEVIDDEEFYAKRKLTDKEKIEAVWKLYIPTLASSVITVAAIIGSNHISSRRSAALVSLYSVADQALKEYQEKVVEIFGEKKETKVRDEIAQDKLDRNPVHDIIITNKGEYLFFDALSGRYFRTDMETVRRVQNDFNELLFNDMFVPLNDLYDMLGLEGTDMGRDIGWDVQKGKLDIKFSAKIATDGEPCIVLGYSIEPRFL
jgi:hypothetical protein